MSPSVTSCCRLGHTVEELVKSLSTVNISSINFFFIVPDVPSLLLQVFIDAENTLLTHWIRIWARCGVVKVITAQVVADRELFALGQGIVRGGHKAGNGTEKDLARVLVVL